MTCRYFTPPAQG